MFSLMQSASEPTQGRAALAGQISQWQKAVKDRRRSCGTLGWLEPFEIVRRRTAVISLLAETNQLRQEAEKLEAAHQKDVRSEAQAKADLVMAAQKRSQAAQNWPDPVVRDFLIGVSSLLDNQGSLAERALSDCLASAPNVPRVQPGLRTGHAQGRTIYRRPGAAGQGRSNEAAIRDDHGNAATSSPWRPRRPDA